MRTTETGILLMPPSLHWIRSTVLPQLYSKTFLYLSWLVKRRSEGSQKGKKRAWNEICCDGSGSQWMLKERLAWGKKGHSAHSMAESSACSDSTNLIENIWKNSICTGHVQISFGYYAINSYFHNIYNVWSIIRNLEMKWFPRKYRLWVQSKNINKLPKHK